MILIEYIDEKIYENFEEFVRIATEPNHIKDFIDRYILDLDNDESLVKHLDRNSVISLAVEYIFGKLSLFVTEIHYDKYIINY